MGKFTEFKLPLKSLSPGSSTYSYKLGKQFFSNMESADIRDADLDVTLTVVYKDDIYALHFDIAGTITLICDRCLDDLILPVETSYDISVEYGDDYNDDSDTLLVIPATDNFLNVAYMIYDTVALTIPMKHVHPMGKCNRAMSNVLKKHRATRPGEDDEMIEGLMEEMDTMTADSQAGEPREADPRWDALKGLASPQEPPTDDTE